MNDIRRQIKMMWNSYPLTVAWFTMCVWITFVVAVVEVRA